MSVSKNLLFFILSQKNQKTSLPENRKLNQQVFWYFFTKIEEKESDLENFSQNILARKLSEK